MIHNFQQYRSDKEMENKNDSHTLIFANEFPMKTRTHQLKTRELYNNKRILNHLLKESNLGLQKIERQTINRAGADLVPLAKSTMSATWRETGTDYQMGGRWQQVPTSTRLKYTSNVFQNPQDSR